MTKNLLEIKNLQVSLAETGEEIIKGVSLEIKQGEFHAIMGKNGSGKTTLAKVILGHPAYKVTKGDILFNEQSILDLKPDERARKGLFLSFQYPNEISGVTFTNFLRTAINAKRDKPIPIKEYLR